MMNRGSIFQFIFAGLCSLIITSAHATDTSTVPAQTTAPVITPIKTETSASKPATQTTKSTTSKTVETKKSQPTAKPETITKPTASNKPQSSTKPASTATDTKTVKPAPKTADKSKEQKKPDPHKKEAAKLEEKTEKIVSKSKPPKTAAELKLMEGFPPPKIKQVNKANALLSAPYNRWAYQHMRTIFPSAPIPNPRVYASLRRSPMEDIDSITVTNPKTNKQVTFEDYLNDTYTDALIIIDGDTIIYEKFLNGMTADSPHQMMSVTKSFAGLLCMIAIAEGKLKESDLITKHVPELKDSRAFNDATVGQLLDMTNSIKFTEDYDDLDSDIREYGAVIGWVGKLPDKEYAASLYEYLPTLKRDTKYFHGSIFHYQTPKTDVVNWITNRATKKSFQEYLYDTVWSKIGASGENYILVDHQGTLVAGGGLNATPNDLAKFAAMMISDGELGGRRVVPSSVIQSIAKGGSIQAFNNGPEAKGFFSSKDWSYRAQWWVRHTKDKEAIVAMGINGQFIYLDLIRHIAIIKQSSQPVSKSNFYDEFNYNAFDAIIKFVSEERAE